MANVRINTRSWLRKCALEEEQVGDTIYTSWGEFEPPVIDPQDGDLTHLVMAGDRIDSLASRYYGDPRFWWVIAQANDMDDPVTALHKGLEIKVPNQRYVRERVAK